MLLKDRRKGLTTLIMKKMKGYENNMSPSMEYASDAKMKDGAEQDNTIALDSAAEEVMQAMKDGNAKEMKNALKSFIMMVVDEYEENED